MLLLKDPGSPEVRNVIVPASVPIGTIKSGLLIHVSTESGAASTACNGKSGVSLLSTKDYDRCNAPQRLLHRLLRLVSKWALLAS